VSADGTELDHVHSIIVKVGAGRAQFDVAGMFENLSNTVHEELADLFWSKYSPWTATNVELENRRLNQILLTLTRYLARPARRTTTAPPVAVPHMGASVVTASGSGAQASNSKSTARPPGRASPRVRTCVDAEQLELA
jgi:hypothetical protein